MDLFEQVEWANWKKLKDPEKEELVHQLLMYFVPPTVEVGTIHLVNFELYGIKCRTFELEFDGELFVFIPGNSEAILGWDLGTEGLRSHELLGFDVADLEKNTFKTTLTNETILPVSKWLEEESQYDLTSLEGISGYINDHTTDLRKVAIPAMFVQKYALPAGTEFLGIFDTITGTFEGEVEQFSQYEEIICEQLFPKLSAEQSFAWTFPKSLLVENECYLEFLPESDYYFVYSHNHFTHEELKHAVKRQGFDLLSEDQWEFAVGGGTRRLFRWGNELLIQDNQSGRQIKSKMDGANMFGLVIDTQQNHFELTNDSAKSKLINQLAEKETVIEKMLPLSTYFCSNHMISADKKLSPKEYLYRKVIKIES
ncbi:hypothetical protein UAW_00684 [Enterococcus haemoperoxidus ATCC BAA-382]|uniref:DUF7278 domain-containing protein n=1 Tax=Enterococcus haemoperoxidus ATCC BAA-382 TaxID=1158608 RepID=R2QSP4_9ENTE|nr:hypothetical protein [Enterococcus haemoperoxidus]EOH99532.1 hypothetical protein UAW_00684 [Enterococcus haemoperoxidus ATCC BAA-382]EOT62728.1 hypothetical protein I583_01729 [Enterococcus haemoperoxidus ATCC BAA-382]OJG55196.1 hypothetical protein RV06_GL002233 [Enterococcus haemoperoxidus]